MIKLQGRKDFVYLVDQCSYDIKIDSDDILTISFPQPISQFDLLAANNALFTNLKGFKCLNNKIQPIDGPKIRLRTNNKNHKIVALITILIVLTVIFILITSLILGLRRDMTNSHEETSTSKTTLEYSIHSRQSFQCYSSTISDFFNYSSSVVDCDNSCLLTKTVALNFTFLSGTCNNFGSNLDIISITKNKIFMVKYCIDNLCNTETVLQNAFSHNDLICYNKTKLYPLPELNSMSVEQCYSCSYCLNDFNISFSVENCSSEVAHFCEVNCKFILFKQSL